MKKLALGVLLGLMACGGGKDPILIDAPLNDAGAACNPVAQTGCAANEKCTWIIDQTVPNEVGHIGCAPVSGSEVGAGESCLDAGDPGGPPPGPSGFDNCVKGAICIARQCQTICDPQAVGAESGCGPQFSCGSYSGLFESGGASVAGACDALCNIFDQKLVVDGAESCGSRDPETGDPSPNHPNRGCYPNGSTTNRFLFNSGSCAPVRRDDSPNNVAGQPLHNDRVDGVVPLTNSAGLAFKNGCAPGFLALYAENDTSMVSLCTGICAPAVLNNVTVVTTPSRATGDVTVVAKLPRSNTAVAGDAICQVGKKGRASPQNCVYLWALSIGTDGIVDPELGPEGEQFGFCFPRTTLNFENAAGTVIPYPDFATLPPRSAGTAGTFPENPDDVEDFAVSPWRTTTALRATAGFFQGQGQIPAKSAIRIANDVKATRR